MRYFSFASRCRIFNQIFPGARPISYKTRKNLITAMASVMEEMTSDESKSVVGKNLRCTSFDVTVIGNGAYGPASLYVCRDNATCLFNCGEGMQRLSAEHGFRILRTRTVFLTYHSWKSLGGIMGLCLSLQSQGFNELIIYGPPYIREIILALRLFVLMKKLTLKIITDRPKHLFDDSYFKVQFVPTYPVTLKNIYKTIPAEKMSHSSDNDSEEEDFGSPSPKRKCVSNTVKAPEPNEVYSLSYICETPEFGMHLDVEKCVALGVPFGPLMGQLKNKMNVKLPNGNIVEWESVCSRKGKTDFFIVVDCPGEEFLEPFVNEPEFAKHQGSSDNPKAAGAVYHFTDTDVMETPKYQEWMSRFPPTTKHIILNRGNALLDHTESYRLQEKLNIIDSEIFPKLKEDNIPEVKKQFSGVHPRSMYVVAGDCGNVQMKKKNVMIADSLLHPEFLKPGLNLIENMNGIDVLRSISTLRWKVYPKTSHPFSHSAFLDRYNCLNEILDIENILEEVKELENVKLNWMKSKECAALPEYPKILFLGTGCSAPYSLRNTSGILVELENGSFVLLDCGEGTYGQLLRFYGKEKVRDILMRLRLIYVTHQHADHHLGLVNLLTARREILSECKEKEYKPESESPDITHLLMILPRSVRDWIHSINRFENVLFEARIIISHVAVQSYNTLKRYTNNIGLVNFKTTMVPHSHESFAVTFATSEGYKLTYSGDTMPSDNLVELGKDSDLLIHEATFEDGLEAMAKQKKHSTMSQALKIGKRMEAKFIMLTHFSQRYSHLPQMSLELPENAAVAFDNMMITPKTMPFLSKLVPFYKKIFADKIIALNSKAMKRTHKEEREAKIKASVKV